MKAFAIKNKEGKYKVAFTDKELAECYCPSDCEVVEITIAETKNLKKDFVSKNYHDVVVKNYKIALKDFGNGQTENEILVQQLAEKDKEIKRLEQQIENNHRDYVSELAYYTAEENIKEIRKQVCEEIYNFIMDNWEKIMGRQGRWQNFSGTCIDLEEDLENIAENGYKKGE